MRRERVHFKGACANVAALIWSYELYGYATKEEFWDALPLETKVKIEEFVLDEKRPPPRKDAILSWGLK